MSVEFEPEITWDGNAILRWAIVNGERIQIRIPREVVHTLPMHNDALEREIDRDKEEIFERLKPKLLADLSEYVCPTTHRKYDLAD